MHLNPSAHTIERSIAFILASHGSLRFYGHFKAEIKILFFYIPKPDVSQTAIPFPTTVVIFWRVASGPQSFAFLSLRDTQVWSWGALTQPLWMPWDASRVMLGRGGGGLPGCTEMQAAVPHPPPHSQHKCTSLTRFCSSTEASLSLVSLQYVASISSLPFAICIMVIILFCSQMAAPNAAHRSFKYPDQRGFVSEMILALWGEEVAGSTEVADIAPLALGAWLNCRASKDEKI